MYTQIAYLKHFFTATNQHGVHSPFVYDYITKCLYKEKGLQGAKCDIVLLKTIPYLSVQHIKTLSEDSQMESLLQKEYDLKVNREPPFDLIYLNAPRTNLSKIHQDEIHNDSVILIKNIHKNYKNTLIWNALKQNETVTVSIDVFYCGLLFFRKEQVKEHFKIRI